jgi:hypothetical protein
MKRYTINKQNLKIGICDEEAGLETENNISQTN